MRVFMLWLLVMIALVIWLAPPFEARERRLQVEVEPRSYKILCCAAANCDLLQQVLRQER